VWGVGGWATVGGGVDANLGIDSEMGVNAESRHRNSKWTKNSASDVECVSVGGAVGVEFCTPLPVKRIVQFNFRFHAIKTFF